VFAKLIPAAMKLKASEVGPTKAISSGLEWRGATRGRAFFKDGRIDEGFLVAGAARRA